MFDTTFALRLLRLMVTKPVPERVLEEIVLCWDIIDERACSTEIAACLDVSAAKIRKVRADVTGRPCRRYRPRQAKAPVVVMQAPAPVTPYRHQTDLFRGNGAAAD